MLLRAYSPLTSQSSRSDFRESCPMHTKRNRPSPSPVRVRQEPPTVAEAVAAAQALTPNLEQQVDITAGLMGLTPDEARPFVLAAPPWTCNAQQRRHAVTPEQRVVGARPVRWLSSSADRGWRVMKGGQGGR